MMYAVLFFGLIVIVRYVAELNKCKIEGKDITWPVFMIGFTSGCIAMAILYNLFPPPHSTCGF